MSHGHGHGGGGHGGDSGGDRDDGDGHGHGGHGGGGNEKISWAIPICGILLGVIAILCAMFGSTWLGENLPHVLLLCSIAMLCIGLGTILRSDDGAQEIVAIILLMAATGFLTLYVAPASLYSKINRGTMPRYPNLGLLTKSEKFIFFPELNENGATWYARPGDAKATGEFQPVDKDASGKYQIPLPTAPNEKHITVYLIYSDRTATNPKTMEVAAIPDAPKPK